MAFQLAGEHAYDEFDIASQLAAERGWMVPAYTLPPNADHVKIMRALVKLTLGHTLTTTLANDIAEACATLEKKGGLHELDRKRVKTGRATRAGLSAGAGPITSSMSLQRRPAGTPPPPPRRCRAGD